MSIVSIPLIAISTGAYRDVTPVDNAIEQPIDDAYRTVNDLLTGPDDDSTYVQFNAGDGSRVTFGIPIPSTIGAANISTIDRLELYIRARRTPAGAGTPKYKAFIYNTSTGGIGEFGSTIEPTTSYATTLHTAAINPLTGLPWALQDFELNLIQVGATRVPVSGQPAIRITQLYALLWYNPAEWTKQLKAVDGWTSQGSSTATWIPMEEPGGSWTIA